MRYADLKRERDEAIARAVEAERLSMKDEVDRIRAECEAEKAELREEIVQLQKYLRIARRRFATVSVDLIAAAHDIESYGLP